jgi:hypothetical protein
MGPAGDTAYMARSVAAAPTGALMLCESRNRTEVSAGKLSGMASRQPVTAIEDLQHAAGDWVPLMPSQLADHSHVAERRVKGSPS